MTTRAEGRDPERVWRRLREDPDYVADWRASAEPTVREAPPYAFRRQTEADLKAVRWNLLAWEDPRHPLWAELFWAHVAMVEARVAEPGEHPVHVDVEDGVVERPHVESGLLARFPQCDREAIVVSVAVTTGLQPAPELGMVRALEPFAALCTTRCGIAVRRSRSAAARARGAAPRFRRSIRRASSPPLHPASRHCAARRSKLFVVLAARAPISASKPLPAYLSYVVFTVSRTWREGAAWPLREQSILLT